MTENDRKKIKEFNRTDVPVPDSLIQNLFEEQAKTRPDKTAVISGDKSLPYKELDADANRLARLLIARNVLSGDIVGICLERSVEMVISVLAVLKAGGCYLPIDPSFPEERINYMLENSGTKILICQDSLNNKFKWLPDISLVIIDKETKSFKNYINEKPDINITSQSFAYLLYTSGSTGKPKGVRIHHKAIVNFIYSMIHAPGIYENDILLAVTTFSFDISVLELFLPISIGATVIIADTKDTTDGSALIDLMERLNITFLQATPSLWNFLVACGWKGNRSLRGICGGEALSSNLVQKVLPKIGEFWNFYGPTETTVWSTGIKITDPDAPVLIGKPIDNTKVYILDDYNNSLPVGTTGEICIGGLGVAKGYFNDPETTARKFISFEDCGVIYKTGDLGKFHEDGNIEFLGRIDNQIKLKGYRIEPGEIESTLARIKGVREAVVKLHKFDGNDERLVAFLNVSDDFKMTKKEIINLISRTLPQYMLTMFFQKSDGFPRMPNGKINKKAPFFDNFVPDSEEEEEVTIILSSTEEVICDIWREVLKVKNISREDNFFEIGGNSLLALSVLSKIESTFGIELGLRIFFDSPRIKDLADTIDIAIQKPVEHVTVDKATKTHLKIVKGEL